KRSQVLADFRSGCGGTRSWWTLLSGCVVLTAISIQNRHPLDSTEWISTVYMPQLRRCSNTWKRSILIQRNAHSYDTPASIISAASHRNTDTPPQSAQPNHVKRQSTNSSSNCKAKRPNF